MIAGIVNWVSLGIAVLMWATTMLLLRRRGGSAKGQLVFSVVILAIILSSLAFELGMLRSFRIPEAWEIVTWLAVLIVAAWGFYRKRLVRAYIFLAIGLGLFFFGMFLDLSTQSAIIYPLDAVAFAFMFLSFLLTLRPRKRDKNNHKLQARDE